MENEEKGTQQIYDENWKDIVEKDGVVDMEQVKKELADFSFLIEEVPKVYCEVTGYRISKPNTYAYEVLTQFNELHLDKSITQDDVRDMIKTAETKEDLIDEIRDYFELGDK